MSILLALSIERQPNGMGISIVHDACCVRQILCNLVAFPGDDHNPNEAGLVEGKPDRIVTLETG